MMMVNRSETCATRRLSQCTGFGFYNDPDDSPDLTELDFYARKAVIEEVADWCDENETKKPTVIPDNRWTPILYRYEIVKTSGKRSRDWGDLVFTDLTISRFLIVMLFPEACGCGNYSHHDYDSLTKYQADRFMSLLTYLHHDWDWGNKPKWVRATYTTPERKFKLNPDFLTKLDSPSSTNKPFMLEKIDNVMAQGSYNKKRTDNASVADKVVGTKETKPHVSSQWKHRNPRQCGFCETISPDKDLQKCSKCKLVFYCGEEW
ncbi:hypothetical protein BT96DRAFT_954782 [Gymnopus androsaceus JB14]|uniref:MYND-type domain-containing protein n=1 Tax=Gymnopus androsaceus JB14 TaxID=1447944 RepID=A0A6A4I9W2_9AGAR|nr:hypothetical protein BT96DRAFT_954782 [Gymnopus androsaceus JB14]